MSDQTPTPDMPMTPEHGTAIPRTVRQHTDLSQYKAVLPPQIPDPPQPDAVGLFVVAVATLVAAVLALCCAPMFLVYAALAGGNLWGGKQDVVYPITDPFAMMALIGVLLPLITSIVLLVLGARQHVVRIMIISGIGCVMAGLAFLLVMAGFHALLTTA